MTEVARIVKTLTNTRKTIKTACGECGIEYSLFEGQSEVLRAIDQCSLCNHWRQIKTLEQDADGFPICKVCAEVYGI